MPKTSNQHKRTPTGSARKTVGTVKNPVSNSKKELGLRQISLRDLDGVIFDTRAATDYFVEHEGVGYNLTGEERRRLFSARVRNNGFIDKANDIAQHYPQFVPWPLEPRELSDDYQRFELLRWYMEETGRAHQVATDAFMQQSDVCYRKGLQIYRFLRDLTKGKIEGAQVLFEALRNFFLNRGRRKSGEPTEKEIERDAKKLLKGKADGSMLIENERPVTIDGEHKVIDDVRTGKVGEKVIEKIA